MKQLLTIEEQSLLQRFYDRDLADHEVPQAEALLNDSKVARVFMAALEELTVAVQVAEEEAWTRADSPSSASLVQAAFEASSLAEAPMSELAPLLERFHDAEVVPEEMATVQALIEERDDVAEYLANLEGLSAAVKVSTEDVAAGVSFDGFWDAVAGQIDEETSASTFDQEEHRVLLYRYHDDEASALEREQVDAWIAAEQPEVLETLAALSEINLATVASIETAQERADLSGLWHAIEDAIDDDIESKGENVVSFERQKRERKGFDSRQGAFVAVAAMLMLAFGAGLFGDQILGGNEKVIVEKTVVIVDSVEYQPGSSVMVNSPMQPVAAVSAAPEAGTTGGEAEEEEPTVIWLLDTADDAPADDAEGADEQPSDAEDTQETSEQPI